MLRRVVYVCVGLLGGLALLVGTASASEIHHRDRYYVALGDSLAYGYQPTHVTGQGYVDQLYAHLHARDPRLRLSNLGCPGETTTSMLRGGVCPYTGFSSQLDAALAFLREHRGEIGLITLDIGANDINGCASGGTINQACVTQALSTIADNGRRIVAELRAVAPFTRIVGMTYYDPFLAAWLTGAAGQQLAAQSVQVSDVFNGLLTRIYRAAWFQVADVAGAFSTDDMTTLVNGVPLDVARICQWTWMCAPAPLGPDIHANQQGYGVIAAAFERVIWFA